MHASLGISRSQIERTTINSLNVHLNDHWIRIMQQLSALLGRQDIFMKEKSDSNSYSTHSSSFSRWFMKWVVNETLESINSKPAKRGHRNATIHGFLRTNVLPRHQPNLTQCSLDVCSHRFQRLPASSKSTAFVLPISFFICDFQETLSSILILNVNRPTFSKAWWPEKLSRPISTRSFLEMKSKFVIDFFLKWWGSIFRARRYGVAWRI